MTACVCVREKVKVCACISSVLFFMLFFFVKSNIKSLMKQEMLKLKIHTTGRYFLLFFSLPFYLHPKKVFDFLGNVYCQFMVCK